MNLRPKHQLSDNPSSNKQFTDRESFIEAFDNALANFEPHDDRYQVLVYYGVGGIGKSALRRHLGKRLDQSRKDVYTTLVGLDAPQNQEADVYWALVDFDAPQNRNPESSHMVILF